MTIPFQSVKHITKEKTAFVFPNAIHIVTTAEKVIGWCSPVVLSVYDITGSLVVSL